MGWGWAEVSLCWNGLYTILTLKKTQTFCIFSFGLLLKRFSFHWTSHYPISFCVFFFHLHIIEDPFHLIIWCDILCFEICPNKNKLIWIPIQNKKSLYVLLKWNRIWYFHFFSFSQVIHVGRRVNSDAKMNGVPNFQVFQQDDFSNRSHWNTQDGESWKSCYEYVNIQWKENVKSREKDEEKQIYYLRIFVSGFFRFLVSSEVTKNA